MSEPFPEPGDRAPVAHPHSDKPGADQADRLSSNINTIVAQYQRSGTQPTVTRAQPLFGDFTTLGQDLQSITEMFELAEDRFMELPSRVRKTADNDWRKFIEMFSTPVGQAELVKNGLRVVDGGLVVEAAVEAATAVVPNNSPPPDAAPEPAPPAPAPPPPEPSGG